MEDKQLLKQWTKLCLKKGMIPICLITTSKDGFPNVFTNHTKETLAKVYKHVLEANVIDETTYLENQEN